MGLDNHRGIENVSLVGDQVGLRANGIVKLLNMAEKIKLKDIITGPILKVPDQSRVLKLISGILQSTAFLSYNAFGFVWGHCFVRALLTFCNFWTVALLPGWIASFLRFVNISFSYQALLVPFFKIKNL